MGVVGVVPFQQVTQYQQAFLNVNVATGTASSSNVVGFKQGPGILNAVIANNTVGFSIYDAQINNSTASAQSTSAGFTTYGGFSNSVVTNATNLLLAFSFGATSSVTASLPLVFDINVPFKNGLVIVGASTSAVSANVLVG